MQSLEDAIACPVCDMVHHVESDQKLICHRCHMTLVTPSRWAAMKVLVLGVLSILLIYGAVTQPFLSIERWWLTSEASLLETAFSFDGAMLVLSLTVLGLILILPALRLLLNIYVLLPIVIDQPPFKHAVRAFRWSETLRPWSMAEVFAIGCGVALVKIADLADVTFGPAFWMFGALVVLLWVQDRLMCRFSIWREVSR